MYALIAGCGKVGHQLTRVLLAMDNEVLVIDKDRRICDTVNEELGRVALLGDATRIEVLKESGAARANLVIAVTARDEDNLAICQTAKQAFNTPRTISVIKDPQNEALFKILGVDKVVNGTHLVVANIEDELPGQSLVHLMSLASQQEIITVTIPEDAAARGKSLGDIPLPPGSFISLVIKPDGPHLPTDDVVLMVDDQVVAVTSLGDERILFETFTGVE